MKRAKTTTPSRGGSPGPLHPINWLIVILSISAPAHASARMLLVSLDSMSGFWRIQDGIDSALHGDTVLVAPGVYHENIVFGGKNIVLMSEGGPACTTIDGRLRDESCVRIVNGEGSGAVLAGFTLTGGSGSAWTEGGPRAFGGGVLVVGAEPTIQGNVITLNRSETGGGAIWCAGSDLTTTWHPVVCENVLSANQTGSLGGAIGVAGNSAPVIRLNVIIDNLVSDGDGGGVAILARISGALVEANRFERNVAGDHGGAVYIGATVPGPLEVEVCGNVLAHNEARAIGHTGDSGGGIWIGGLRVWVHQNTLVSNAGRGGVGDWGGGIAVAYGDPLIERNIIALSSEGGGIHCSAGGAPRMLDNLAWENTGGNGSGECIGWDLANANIVADPLFCDSEGGDYTVSEYSPALTHASGWLGALEEPGCKLVGVVRTTWSQLKWRFLPPDVADSRPKRRSSE